MGQLYHNFLEKDRYGLEDVSPVFLKRAEGMKTKEGKKQKVLVKKRGGCDIMHSRFCMA